MLTGSLVSIDAEGSVLDLKVIISILTGLFVAYTVWQSYLIASTGALYHIPQLEGDGGGGLVFAGLCFIAGVALFIRPILSAVIYVLAALVISFIAVAFQDSIDFLWTLIALSLGTLAVVSRIRSKRRIKTQTGKVSSGRTILHR
ncbi:hypothetical protein [Alicyclobacillus sp. SO9]|uniref:hypothetical protein n=1 Tax=Alicyclobacillus sp. SO9 TaxID=2665646 RepID=UPI0018E79EE1|nr:hypothetical protein [Alicyclobacillus sp. SO9]QQE81012.1 hypothetical protein GI364_11900 [Alicyclobacillus sp. SO9]